MEKANLRFTKDYNLPINIFSGDYFSYYRSLYSRFWPYKEESLMHKEIIEAGNVDKWLENYSLLRDKIIYELENSDAYKAFNTSDLSIYDITPTVGERSYYNHETDGKYFISVDLKKANFQALRHVGVIKDRTYEDFITRMGGSEYFASSKYLRQVIFGKLNPKRQTKVEKYLLKKVENFLSMHLGCELFSFGTDEIVYSWNSEDMPTMDYLAKFKFYENYIKDMLDIDIRIEFVHIKRLPIINAKGASVDAYVRTNTLTGEVKLKKASTTFYPQIYKLWMEEEITDMDKTFFFEGQLATFKEPLRYTKNEDISD